MAENDKADLEQYIISPEALYDSMLKCKRGVIRKGPVAYYVLHGIEETLKLSDELNQGSYKPGRTHKVKITYPKPRTAVATQFRDRVYQRSLNDNAIYPAMTRSFIYDNMACQTGKGPDKMRARLKKMLRRAWKKWGGDACVLEWDVEGYYRHIRHDAAKAPFERNLPPGIYRRAANVLDTQYHGTTGYDPGSQMVQIAGLSVLNSLDHFIKELLHQELYCRYMDDGRICGTYEELVLVRDAIEKFLGYLGLKLHPKKTKIVSIYDGSKFLGFIFRVTKTGRVITLIDPKKIKSWRKRIFRQAKLLKNGTLSREKSDQMLEGMINYVSKGNTYKAVNRTLRYYKDCMEEGKWNTNEDASP